jgi:winged helix DNA-binding protein
LSRAKTIDSLRGITHRRLANQLLSTRGLDRAADVVRLLGAVQAQDYAGAKWALAQRMRDATDASIEDELSAGHILRTHVLRPTWHFVAPGDIRWMLALTAPRVKQAMAFHGRANGLTPSIVRRSNDVIAKALSGGKQLTRPELGAALERARIRDASGQRLAHLVMNAELDAIVCSGARRGSQFTYALLDERVPATDPIERDEALLMLARRYFSTRGPATARDFAWWSGLAMSDVKRALQTIEPELEKLTRGDEALWFTPGRAPRQSPSAHLLPNYDEYFIGYKDRNAIGERLGHVKAVIGGDARIANVVFVDGQLVGGWRRTLDKRKARVDVVLWCELAPAEHARVAAAGKAFAAFVGVTCEIRTSGGI